MIVCFHTLSITSSTTLFVVSTCSTSMSVIARNSVNDSIFLLLAALAFLCSVIARNTVNDSIFLLLAALAFLCSDLCILHLLPRVLRAFSTFLLVPSTIPLLFQTLIAHKFAPRIKKIVSTGSLSDFKMMSPNSRPTLLQTRSLVDFSRSESSSSRPEPIELPSEGFQCSFKCPWAVIDNHPRRSLHRSRIARRINQTLSTQAHCLISRRCLRAPDQSLGATPRVSYKSTHLSTSSPPLF